MKSIMTRDPYFHTLPRGATRLRLVWQSHFFDEVEASGDPRLEKVPETAPDLHPDVTIPIQSAGQRSQGYAH